MDGIKKCGFRAGRNNFKDIIDSAIEQDEIFGHYFNTFVELATNRFKWENLPPEIDPRYMELSLLNTGGIIFFYEPPLGEYMALQCAWTGFDNYFNPVDFQVVTPTGFTTNVAYDEGVMVWNNFMRTPDISSVYMFAKNIANVYASALVNVNAQKHPVAIVAQDEKEKLSLQNAYLKYQGNHPVLFVKGSSTPIMEKFQTIDTKAPFVAPELFEIKDKMMEEFMKWLGVKMPLVNGRERLVAQEQSDANAVTWQLRNRGLHSRQLACEQINARFGLDLRVSFNEDLQSLVAESGVEE